MRRRYLLDTSALLAHFRAEPGAEEVQALFDDDDASLWISAASIPELARRLRAIQIDAGQAIEFVERYLAIVDGVVAIDREVAFRSVTILESCSARLPLVDALIAASAQAADATLVHRDAHFRPIEASSVTQRELDAEPG